MSEVSPLLINAVGTLAGLASMSSFIPQIAKILRDRNASGVSLGMFAVTVTAFSLWTLYGALSTSWPVAISNGICLALSGTIMLLRLRFGDGES